MRPLTILYAEDYRLLMQQVRRLLEDEGWRVEVCADGRAALEKIAGDESYDLLLLDNSLPGVTGLELARRARLLTHRRRTPIIMLSASETATEAEQAGVNLFLKKPEQIQMVVAAIRNLVA
ncbi:MAG TPA: response regulator [Pyrinomonadaceae bacterium]|jgi:CheY-like chemotaxis protein